VKRMMSMNTMNENDQNPVIPSFDDIVDEITNNDSPLRNTILVGLSSMTSQEFEFLKDAFLTIEPPRRHKTLSRLVELANDNIELNFDRIFKYCLQDDDSSIRRLAIDGLWENEELSLIKQFIELLLNDESEDVQTEAANALGKYVLLAVLDKIPAEYITAISSVLLDVIHDITRPIDVRRRSLEAISSLSIPEVTAVIEDCYHSNDERLIVSSLFAMGHNCDPSWFPLLFLELKNPDAESRYEAARACGEIGEEEAVPYLVQMMNDADIDVTLVSIQALGKIATLEAKLCLQKQLTSTDAVIREAADQSMKELLTNEELLLMDISNSEYK